MTISQQSVLWRENPVVWPLLVVTILLAGVVFYESLVFLVDVWNIKEEYSYGYLIPFITMFLIWQKWGAIEKIRPGNSWVGIALVGTGSLLFVIGELATLYIVIQYAFIFVVAGLFLSFMGWSRFRVIAVPVVILFFMVPLPDFLLQRISIQLQLISSSLGVFFIQLFGISVYLEGNVIDLGNYKLQVVEACNGLRYLFPLMTFGFIAAYFFADSFWKKIVVFLSTIPITVIMNSLRIGMIGVTVEYWGAEMAEGFLHDFEGWVVFMVCAAILLAEMWLLARIGNDGKSFTEKFAVELPSKINKDEFAVQYRKVPLPFVGATFLVVLLLVSSLVFPKVQEIIPSRKEFFSFPMRLGDWRGSTDNLAPEIIEALKFDDYLLANYEKQSRKLNFYIAYYGSQKKGVSAHSPRSCIPGGGWEIQDLSQRVVEGVNVFGKPLKANRVVVQKGQHKQLVYYWFQQRGRIITNEYAVKWYLFWDAMTRNRTDGALVRVVASVPPGADIAGFDRTIVGFIQGAMGEVKAYIPE